MDYELAKKLKDMGFPKIRFTTFTATGSDEVILLEGPTLSELIEACGDKMVALQRGEVFNGPNYEVKKGGWEAVSRWESYNPPEIDESFPFGKGKTPEEAVAKLWIELNK